MSKEMKVALVTALISAAAIIVAALIGLVPTLVSHPLSPSPNYPSNPANIQPSASPTPTDIQAPPDAQSPYPPIQGNYSGSEQNSSAGVKYSFTLKITSQDNQGDFYGKYTNTSSNDPLIDNGDIIENGTVDRNGNIRFYIQPGWMGGELVLMSVMFMGNAQSGGGWQGTWTDSNATGTWDAGKCPQC